MRAVDDFIVSYYAGDFMADLRQLTPYQRVSLFARCVSMRLPKFKAIDLHTTAQVSITEIQKLVGRVLGQAPISPQ